jgi:hypothetical protein
MSRLLILALAASGLAACTPGYDMETQRRAALKYDGELAGLVAGRPQNCLPPRSNATIVAARNGTLLFREGSTVYANATTGGCEELADSHYAMVTNDYGTGAMCRGTLAKVVDLTASGMIRGTCVLGDFTPYRRAR